MKCPACTSEDQRVMSTRQGPDKIVGLRCCDACGHRWPTMELSTASISKMEQAVQVVRSFSTLSKQLDAEAAHG